MNDLVMTSPEAVQYRRSVLQASYVMFYVFGNIMNCRGRYYRSLIIIYEQIDIETNNVLFT